jgi:hypothetical protein
MTPWIWVGIIGATGIVLGIAWWVLDKLEDLRQAHDDERYSRR